VLGDGARDLAMVKNIHQYLGLTLCFLFTAAAGYYLQALRDRPASARAGGSPIGLDYFMPVQSFSEIENARGILHALAARSLQELRHRRIEVGRPEGTVHDPDLDREAQVERLIGDFQLAIRDFEGTGQEWIFVQDLLWFLKNERRHEEWVDLFLHALYRYPTHEMIPRLAPEAVRLGRMVRREDDILEAMEMLRAIPVQFARNPASPVLGEERRYLVQSEIRNAPNRSID
jgi:hypothetical protein